MKLLLVVMLAAASDSVYGYSYGVGGGDDPGGIGDDAMCGKTGDCDCDCQYFSGGCRVRKILQNDACSDHCFI